MVHTHLKHMTHPNPKMATNINEGNDVTMRKEVETEDFDDDEEEDQNWEDWNADNGEEGDDGYDEEFMNSEMLCLFCNYLFSSSSLLFEHCASAHHFDFNALKQAFNLDFYGRFKLINYIRSQVVENKCWCCGITCKSNQDLLNHLHEVDMPKDKVLPWDDDKYLRPVMQEDPLLYNFGDDDIGEDEDCMSFDEEELIRDLSSFEEVSIDDKDAINQCTSELRIPCDNGGAVASAPQRDFDSGTPLEEFNGLVHVDEGALSNRKLNDKKFDISSAKVVADEIKNINNNYFGSYSSFGIHREMISDKVRTDAYKEAILRNPSLIRGAVIMDVGCGTGILSLFAAQAGASRVIAVEASNKMASVAAQIAKDNGLLRSGSTKGDSLPSGVIEIVQGMVEELDIIQHIQPHSVDVILSEWMGYCLLYESMLGSVLFARDKWLKPGGALLPDTATLFAAGFGKGGTSLPFWENVYGFNMSCVGKEIDKGAARIPIVDVINGCDVVTSTAVLQAFDLMTMKSDEMDFTAKVELEPKNDNPVTLSSELESKTQCHGLVLWFETGFTRRFCKEMPTILSTSPHTPKTHWSQTILTFQEPITITLGKHGDDGSGAVGSDTCPATKIHSRISIVRAAMHRSIDISMELSAIGPDGRKRSWPVQMFSLS